MYSNKFRLRSSIKELSKNSDVSIILNGGDRIPAHYLVFFTRCEEICTEIIVANGIRYLEIWSHLTKNVVEAFLSFLYCGELDLDLITPDDLESAKYLSRSYPRLRRWILYINSLIRENENDQPN